MLGIAVHALTHVPTVRAQQPQAPTRSGTASGTSPATGKPAAAPGPDDGFIEFLGSDDSGDPVWWELLKKAPPRGTKTPAPPPQDAKS